MASVPEEPVDAAEIPVEEDQQNEMQGLCRNMSNIFLKYLGRVKIVDYNIVVLHYDLLAALFQVERLYFLKFSISVDFFISMSVKSSLQSGNF